MKNCYNNIRVIAIINAKCCNKILDNKFMQKKIFIVIFKLL